MPIYNTNIKEEELKNKVARDYFADYDSTRIIGNIDFCIAIPQKEGDFEIESLLWAESKRGNKKDIYESFVQLILTIGKARTFDNFLPPKFIGAFDTEKIAFLPYYNIIDVFSQNDFNWNVTPSDHETKEFRLLYDKVKDDIERGILPYRFGADDKELHSFIKKNFTFSRKKLSTIRINKNNFTHIYQKWLAEVKPSIAIDWEIAKKEGLIDADFYLADILSEHNVSLREKLFVLLRQDRYVYNIQHKPTGAMSFDSVDFNDKQKNHTQFWNRYDRPPKREYWDYIAARRDLLVPQDVRERKGSFFTPKRWVELSQQYLSEELGENWQDEYYVWDCAAGTGNLLNGLTNKYNIWASTLDAQDVSTMHDLISANKLNLLEKHVFQFDFLNDSFDKLPQPLRDIINDEEIEADYGILKHDEGIDLMPGNIELAGLEVSLVNVMSRELVLRSYIEQIRDRYSYILIDCMPSLGMMTINALACADSVLIPVQAAYLPVKGLEQLIKTIGRVKRQLNPKLEIEGILLTMVDSRTNYARDISALLVENYGNRVRIFENSIPMSVRAAETSAEGISIYQHDPKGRVADAYQSLTKEVLGNGQ